MNVKSIDELITFVKSGKLTEHKFTNVELKRSWDKTYGDKISMLCNTFLDMSSFLVIGVEDDGSLSGHNAETAGGTLEVISNQLHQMIDPVLSICQLVTECIETSFLVIVEVRNPGVVVKWNKHAYVGHGTTKRRLDESEILELSLKLPGMTDLSKTHATFTPIDFLVNNFAKDVEDIPNQHILDKTELKNKKAGEILFGNTGYRVIKYDDHDDIVSNEERKGLYGLLSNEFRDEVRLSYSTRMKDVNRISDVLLRESLGNAVAHAAYQDNAGEIIIEIKKNGFEISNLVYQDYVSLANKWFSNAHKSPNRFLMEVLRLSKKVDEVGRGKRRLFSECIKNGFEAPHIELSDAGRFKRWRLIINVCDTDRNKLKLLESLIEQYDSDKEKALIAYAIILWKDKKVTEISKYFDKYDFEIAVKIITDLDGPVFYWKERDEIRLNRWVEVLLSEGTYSKQFTKEEEDALYESFYDRQNHFHKGYFQTKDIKNNAHLSDSKSDRSLVSNLMKKWVLEKKITKIKKGSYKFIERQASITPNVYEQIMADFKEQ